jgi:hypothetical protein
VKTVYILSKTNVQQAVGGVAEPVLILGMWFESHYKFLNFFSKLMNSFSNEFI